MLHDQDIPLELWVEACNMKIYVHNRSPHRILEEKTHEEAFTGVRPKIGNLKYLVVQYISMFIRRRG